MMSFGGLWERIVSRENLELAASVQAATGILKFWGLRGLAVSALDV